jgi:hypothetical protein
MFDSVGTRGGPTARLSSSSRIQESIQESLVATACHVRHGDEGAQVGRCVKRFREDLQTGGRRFEPASAHHKSRSEVLSADQPPPRSWASKNPSKKPWRRLKRFVEESAAGARRFEPCSARRCSPRSGSNGGLKSRRSTARLPRQDALPRRGRGASPAVRDLPSATIGDSERSCSAHLSAMVDLRFWFVAERDGQRHGEPNEWTRPGCVGRRGTMRLVTFLPSTLLLLM